MQGDFVQCGMLCTNAIWQQSSCNRIPCIRRPARDFLETCSNEGRAGAGRSTTCVTANIIISLLRRGTYSQMRQAENRIYTTLRHTEPLIRRCNQVHGVHYCEHPFQWSSGTELPERLHLASLHSHSNILTACSQASEITCGNSTYIDHSGMWLLYTLITFTSRIAAMPTAATAAVAARLIYCSNAQLTRKRRVLSHNATFALQRAIDLAPVPPDHLGEPRTQTPLVQCALSNLVSIIHSADLQSPLSFVQCIAHRQVRESLLDISATCILANHLQLLCTPLKIRSAFNMSNILLSVRPIAHLRISSAGIVWHSGTKP